MAWDKNMPSGTTTLLPDVDDRIRENNAALETALNAEHEFVTGGEQTGYHKFPSGNTADRPAAGHNGRIYLNTETNKIERDTGTEWVIAHHEFPSGTKMLFAQASAPTGWTKVTDWDDRVIRIVSGDGGGTGGSWTISGGSITIDGHTLTIDEIPSHTHGYHHASPGTDGPYAEHNCSESSLNTLQTDAVGGGQPHSHTGSFSHDGSWRPAYLDVICAKKD